MLSALVDDDRLLDVSLEDPDLARSRLRLTTHVLMDAESVSRVAPPGHAQVFVFPLLGDDFKADLVRRLTRDERTSQAGPLGGSLEAPGLD